MQVCMSYHRLHCCRNFWCLVSYKSFSTKKEAHDRTQIHSSKSIISQEESGTPWIVHADVWYTSDSEKVGEREWGKGRELCCMWEEKEEGVNQRKEKHSQFLRALLAVGHRMSAVLFLSIWEGIVFVFFFFPYCFALFFLPFLRQTGNTADLLPFHHSSFQLLSLLSVIIAPWEVKCR